MSNIFSIRSNDEWVVELDGYYRVLKASVGADPLLPPTTGWLFNNQDTKDFEEDQSLTCAPPLASSPPCCLTIHLTGPAKAAAGQCEGVYHSTELMSDGRKVYEESLDLDSSYHFSQVFKLEGSDDFYLYVGNGQESWSIWSSLKKEKIFLDSGSASHPCPAHPSNASNDRNVTKEWKFNTAEDKVILKEGGVVINCSTHAYN